MDGNSFFRWYRVEQGAVYFRCVTPMKYRAGRRIIGARVGKGDERMIGVIGGLFMAGLLAGGITGSIWVLLVFVAAGTVVAGSWKLVKLSKLDNQLAKYPSYKY